jgi:LmbE family N-acetylglucosaminyl deacetylase
MPTDDKKNGLRKSKTVALIVAHPDDETLWAGGTILGHRVWNCFVVCLCRKSDPERSRKFFSALKALGSDGVMGDLDDGPMQEPLVEAEVGQAILSLLPFQHFDLIITHDQNGEYTRHLRHEETGRAVKNLWRTGRISCSELWTFAYEDGNRKYYPRPVQDTAVYKTLSKRIWMKKLRIITEIYGFAPDSWEAETTPAAEAFRKYKDPSEFAKRLNYKGAIL